MMHKRNLLLSVMLIAVAACESNSLGAERSTAYFKEHPAKREHVLAECEADPQRHSGHPNCINAWKAQWEVVIGLTHKTASRLSSSTEDDDP